MIWVFGVIALSVVGVLLAQTIATRSFPIDGLYWISLPASPRPLVTNAEQLKLYGPFTTVARFRRDTNTFYTWDGATCLPSVDPESVGPTAPCTTSCFCVIPGEGYQVRVTGAPQNWDIVGYDGITRTPIVVQGQGNPSSLNGTNFVALPIELATGFGHASDLLVSVNTSAGSQVAASVARFLTATGLPQSYTGSRGSTDFPLAPGEAYLVRATGLGPTFQYTPPQPGQIFINPCIGVPTVDGTIPLPPPCGYYSPAQVHVILNGFPPSTELRLNANHQRFFNVHLSEALQPGNTVETFDSDLEMHLTGTGILSTLDCPVTMTPVHVVVETEPPQAGQPIQDFKANMRSLTGNTFLSDPPCNPFQSLILEAGTDHGLSSPGHVREVRRPDGTYDVNSYFDINVRMSFVGKPGSVLDGMSGTTTQIVRMGTGSNIDPWGGSGTIPPVPDGTFGTAMTCSRAAPDGSAIALNWDVSTCTGQNYNVLYGSLANLRTSYALNGAGCALAAVGQATWSGVPAGSLWFVIASQSGSGVEGSWGTNSAGAERNGSSASGQCGNTNRDNTGSCP
jgi:hypothetical protein